MLYEGVESCSYGIHWIHWTRIDSIGDVDFLFVRDLEKCHHVVEGVESCILVLDTKIKPTVNRNH